MKQEPGYKKRPIFRMLKILRRTGMLKVLSIYIAVICIGAVLVMIFEPKVNNFGDGLWYCFVSSTTIGFGDFYAVSTLGRIITVAVAVSGIITVAVIPGVIVSYYTEYLHLKEDETISTFLEKLENLPNLSHNELKDLAQKIKKINKKK